MNDILIHDSLNAVEKVMSSSVDKGDPINIWMLVAIGQFAIIIGLILVIRLKNKPNAKKMIKDEILTKDVDFNNIIKSSFYSTELYDILKVKCHPDKFATDPVKNAIADKLYQNITKNKTNLKRLEELKIEAQQKLNIDF